MENKDSHLIEHLDELRQRMINTWSVSYFFLVVLPIKLSVIISKIGYKKKVVSDTSM
ncbi:hypothetical protein AB1L12_22940 [Peribacillus frigoritolerans]|uniref:hypothetical protein n=1 Tax=Peribacillus frigoritolerans TaxID=450367 RepID=UPI00399FDBF0